ncbi:MAG: CAP domain-containing protein [Candidatus Pacebacteria bacterium]|nr:CAP domain-containing protein [Candidatus Paceibacterota bacterium]
MFSWLKKHFIPHEGNNHRPHILRDVSTRNIVAIIILFELFTFLIPTLTHLNTKGGMATVLPAVLDDLTNIERQSQNLPTLTVSPILNKAAEMKANDMATKSYFSHTSPEGKTPWYWLMQVGYKYQYAGENLAINFSDSRDVTNAWMASPTHRANIVKGNYTEIGTGIAKGIYQGRETIFVAQVYANPLPETVTQNQPQKTTTKITVTTPKVANTKEPANVLGTETVENVENTPNNAILNTTTNPIQNPTFWQKLLASPRNTTNIILYVIFGIIFIALLLYIILKMKNHHIDLITNGLIVLAIIGAIFSINYYLSHHNMIITQSLDYSIQN